MKVFYFSILVIIFTACTEVIDVPMPEQEKKIVIEARITNLQNLDQNYVEVSKTSYLNEADNPFVSGAKVSIVEENSGTTIPFQQFFEGTYYLKNKTNVTAGNTYTLTVAIKDSIYTATDKMPNLTEIDSMYFKYLEVGDTPLFNAEGYYLHVVFKDNPTENNYYAYGLGYPGNVIPSLKNGVFDDKLLNPNQNVILVPYPLQFGETIYFTLQSLSQKAYEYHRGLLLQLSSDGGFFTTPPANPTSNISNGALGFFMATQISFDTLTVQ